jgi:hypothetical protein
MELDADTVYEGVVVYDGETVTDDEVEVVYDGDTVTDEEVE